MAKENNQRVRYLTPDEESRLFKVLPEKYHISVLSALHTGMRKTEQFSLEWRDVDFVRGQIKVRVSKSGNSRIIAMNKTLTEALKYLSKVRLIKKPYVFPGEKPVARRTDLPKYWEQYLQSAGIENFHWHDLRHTFASRLVIAGGNLYSVKELLGHHDLKMTRQFAHLSPRHLKAAIGVLDDKRTSELAPGKVVNL